MNTPIIRKIVFIPLLFIVLQSCFVAKDYQQPEVVNESQFRTDMVEQDTSTIADISWRDIFTDSLLVNYIEKGLDNNIDIRVALKRIDAAGAYYKQGKAAWFPTLSAGPTVTHQILSNNSQFGAFFDGSITQYDITGNLSWEIDLWGKIRSGKRAYEATFLQSVAAHQAVKTELVANISSMYFQLLALDEQLKITEETIANRQSSLETTRALKDAGTVTEVGVKQTEAQLYSAQALLVNLKLNIKLLENTFSIILGDEPQEIARTSLDAQDFTPELQYGVPAQLLRNRPDVIAAEYGLVNAFELTNVAKTNFYPSLNLSASGGFQSLELDKLLNVNSLFANIVGSLAQPIVNGRRIRTQHEVAQSQQEQAYLNFRYALINASREVSDALYSYNAAEEIIEIRTKEFEANELATNYSMELLNNGFANYLEVLTARTNVLNSELNLINARADKLISAVELYRALGGGWR